MDLTKSYYKIGEVAEMLEVPQSTIRYWETEFPEAAPMRTSGNRRYYTVKNIEVLEIIRFLLKDRGMKIEAARMQLRTNADNVTKRMEILKTLRGVREELTEMLKALEKRR